MQGRCPLGALATSAAPQQLQPPFQNVWEAAAAALSTRRALLLALSLSPPPHAPARPLATGQFSAGEIPTAVLVFERQRASLQALDSLSSMHLDSFQPMKLPKPTQPHTLPDAASIQLDSLQPVIAKADSASLCLRMLRPPLWASHNWTVFSR